MSSTYQITPWLSTGLRYRYNSGTPYNRLFRNDVTGNWDLYRATVGIRARAPTSTTRPTTASLRMPDIQDFNVAGATRT